jgi:hypothetical protein
MPDSLGWHVEAREWGKEHAIELICALLLPYTHAIHR